MPTYLVRSIFTLLIIICIIQLYFIIEIVTIEGGSIFAIVYAYVVLVAIINWFINLKYRRFSIAQHQKWVSTAQDNYETPLVDVYLPVCGEPIAVLQRTWEGVKEIDYSNLQVYVLDDKGNDEVKQLAKEYGYHYLHRPNAGHLRKAGNLQYGYQHSKGKYFLILDADFCPEKNIIKALKPYLDQDEKVAIVQSPQVFEKGTTWIEKGAITIQKYFYKIIQPSKENWKATICCGSCALYRREAFAKYQGCVSKEHSEDLWNSFMMQVEKRQVNYVPIPLAKGYCPNTIGAYYRQQKRWAGASMSLVLSRVFWQKNARWSTKLAYLSGFLYYTCSLWYLALPLIALFTPHIVEEGIILQLSCLLNYVIILAVMTNGRFKPSAILAHFVIIWASIAQLFSTLTRQKTHWTASGDRRQSRIPLGVMIGWGVYTFICAWGMVRCVSEVNLWYSLVWLSTNMVLSATLFIKALQEMKH